MIIVLFINRLSKLAGTYNVMYYMYATCLRSTMSCRALTSSLGTLTLEFLKHLVRAGASFEFFIYYIKLLSLYTCSMNSFNRLYFSLTAAPPVMSKLRMSSVHVSSDVLFYTMDVSK